MYEVDPTVYSNLKLWWPHVSYSLGDYVLYGTNIYKALSSVGPVAITANPSVDSSNWSLFDIFLSDQILSGDTLNRWRQSLNKVSLSTESINERLRNIEKTKFYYDGVWQTGRYYPVGAAVTYGDEESFYICNTEHFSSTFLLSNWTKMIDMFGIRKTNKIIKNSDMDGNGEYQTQPGGSYLIDTNSGMVILNLPQNPNLNTKPVSITHIGGDVNTPGEELRIQTKDGTSIMGVNDILNVDKNNGSFYTVFSDASHGWRLTVL